MTENDPTYSIEVTAVSFYLAEQSDPDDDHYVFAYRITLKNTGSITAQLVSRHWIITDGNGDQQEVRGLGVVGEHPELAPGESFEYTSGSALTDAGRLDARHLPDGRRRRARTSKP